jgi:hypothetical protein
VLRHAGIAPDDATARAADIHERTWAALDAYREPDEMPGWWDGFVRKALGRPSALAPDERQALRILTE